MSSNTEAAPRGRRGEQQGFPRLEACQAVPGYTGHRPLVKETLAETFATSLRTAAAKAAAMARPPQEPLISDRTKLAEAFTQFDMGGEAVKYTQTGYVGPGRKAENLGTHLQREVKAHIRSTAPMGLATETSASDYVTSAQLGPGNWHDSASAHTADRRMSSRTGASSTKWNAMR